MDATTTYPPLGGHTSEWVGWDERRRSGRLAASHTADTDGPAMRVLVVPGNPGVADFYVPFAAQLRRSLGPAASVHILSHLGHQLKPCTGGAVFSLRQQIQHHLHAVEHLMRPRAGGPILPTFVVGHSIGAYIALELLRRSPNKVCGVVGLFPFLQVDKRCWTQSSIWCACVTYTPSSVHLHIIPPFFARLRLRSAWFVSATAMFASGVGMLPTSLQRGLLAVLGPTGRYSAEAAETVRTALTQPLVVKNAAFMARTEFEDLGPPPDVDFLRAAAAKVAMLFTPNDHWGPLWMHEQLKCEVPKLQNEVMHQVSHGFVTTHRESAAVAERTGVLLRTLWERHRADT